VARPAVGATADLSFESTRRADALPVLVSAFVDAARLLGRVTGLTTAPAEEKESFATAAFGSVFESTLASFASGFSVGAAEAGALMA
jgi:hypothetical protein